MTTWRICLTAVFFIAVVMAVDSGVGRAQVTDASHPLRRIFKEASPSSPFNDPNFDPGSFNPEMFDPLVIEADWARAGGQVIAWINRTYGQQLRTTDVELFFAEVGQASSIDENGKVTVSVSYGVRFSTYNDSARAALIEGLGLPQDCVVRAVRTTITVPFSVSAFKTRYKVGNGLDLPLIASDTGSLINASGSLFRQLGLESTPAYVNDSDATVVTGWKEIRRTNEEVLYWRMYFRVGKNAGGTWDVTTKVQVGRKTPAQHDRWIKVIEDFEQATSSRYQTMLSTTLTSSTSEPGFMTTTRDNIVTQDGQRLIPPLKASPLEEMRFSSFDRFKDMLIAQE